MKAIAQQRYGSADVLEFADVDRPVPKDDEVLVRVHAASVNALDWHTMRGSPMVIRPTIGTRRPGVVVRGVDVAGRVEAVGSNVTRFAPDDDVFGWCNGAFAEYVAAGEHRFAPKPPSLSFEEAAAVPLAATTALQGLRDAGRLQAGQRVLIVGASGGVGTFAVQIAKALGADVTGVCSAANAELVRSLGADRVIDYARDDLTSDGLRYDLIFELAGTWSARGYLRLLTPKGTLVLSSGAGRGVLGPVGRMLKGKLLSPFVSQRIVILSTTHKADDLVAIAALIESGKVRPVIDRSYALREAPAAIRYVEVGHTRGKTVITV